ncbi:unnamed protein product [Hermetia illucens]|uniref:AB hydrolase-1 domain-containing protein n=1 Tax=Hermetia illucens TaxID=343691 RepID=A0A7R8UDN2_HERIL|nr:unnamed protein product [Hermetia illucens]
MQPLLYEACYLLWDLGYDVWLGNARGNRYSKKHKSLNPKEKDFWQFSWHEIGIYDLPAMIDYILNATEYQKLFYAGHSQGTTSFFVMCSRRPEFNKKIILMQALAPVAFMTHIKTPYARIFNRFRENALRTIGEFEMLPQGKMASMCVSSENLENVMINMFFNMVGKNEKEFNRTMWPAMCYHLPAGAATNQVVHYSQLIQSGRFCEYDYGPQINEERYGTKIPPKYDLSKVTAPVALYYSENDYLTAPVDVEYLYTQLGNPVEKYFVPMPEFNHMDFVWGIHVRKLVYERFLQVMQNYTNKGSVENVTEEV